MTRCFYRLLVHLETADGSFQFGIFMTVYLHFSDNSVLQAEYAALTTDCSGCCVRPVIQDRNPGLGLRIGSRSLSPSRLRRPIRMNYRSDAMYFYLRS
jgi:hypothetical protein